MTEVKQLKAYKGYCIEKVIDNEGTRFENVTYMLNDKNDDNIDCFKNLKELKKYVDNVL